MISRRQFLQLSLAAATTSALGYTRPVHAADGITAFSEQYLPLVKSYRKSGNPQPNVLFIGIDDLNDWVGCMGGHPNGFTPNIDRLANRSVLFERAYCTYPMCNASRAALMTGIAPHTSGIYTNTTYFRNSPVLQTAATIPEYFRIHGYRAFGAGKMYCSFADPQSWNDYWPALDIQRPEQVRPPDEDFPLNGMDVAGPFFDWGPLDVAAEEMGDWQVASKVSEMLGQTYNQPFFMTCGFFGTHQPFYAPRQYFDRFPLQEIELPMTLSNDLDDLPSLGIKLALGTGEHEAVTEQGQWKEAVQGYLACMAMVDDCVGLVLDALDNSPHRDNTIVVLWSDHGWHLGEKQHWKKNALWEDTTRNILMFSGPGIGASGTRVQLPVSLLDIYPTLIDLCGLAPNPSMDGHSLYPLLGQERFSWPYPAITSVTTNHNRDVNFAVRKENWRYIRYANGTEELYNLDDDPNEWHNLAKDESYLTTKRWLQTMVPEDAAPAVLPGIESGIDAEQAWILEQD